MAEPNSNKVGVNILKLNTRKSRLDLDYSDVLKFYFIFEQCNS